MVEFNDPFLVTVTPDLCDNDTCPPCSGAIPEDDCIICGYPTGVVCASGCLDGAVDCLDCENTFSGLDIKFLGGFVSGFSSKLGFGASESTVNIEIVVPHKSCNDQTISAQIGVCCEPDQSCSTLYIDQTDCENAGGIWVSNATCDDDPCSCATGCLEPTPKYEGKLGYIYTFNMGAFCFRGILSNHTYSEDSSGYRYRITLTDGRSILSNIAVLLNGLYSKLPIPFQSDVINATASEKTVIDNECGTGKQCKDFMTTGSNSIRGIKIKSALETINGKCISIPISNAGLKINLTKLINLISEELRTTNRDSTVLELIVLATEESGYDFIVTINNNNEFEILPINYKRPATEKSLFNFIEDLTAKDIVISKEYGEEMAGSSSKNKRIVFGNNLSYLTTVNDFSYQLMCDIGNVSIDQNGVCCKYGLTQTLPNSKEDCDAIGGIWYPYFADSYNIPSDICEYQPQCTIKNNPASIGADESTHVTPQPYPAGC